MPYLMIMLTNDIVSFEQLVPGELEVTSFYFWTNAILVLIYMSQRMTKLTIRRATSEDSDQPAHLHS